MTELQKINARILALLELIPATLAQLSTILGLHRASLSPRLRCLRSAGRLQRQDTHWMAL